MEINIFLPILKNPHVKTSHPGQLQSMLKRWRRKFKLKSKEFKIKIKPSLKQRIKIKIRTYIIIQNLNT